MITMKIDTDVDRFNLRFSSSQLKRAVGTGIARVVKKRLRAGVNAAGERLKEAKDNQSQDNPSRGPLKRTGRLITSITYYKGDVVPHPGRRHEGSRVNMAGLMGVMVFGRKNWKDRTGKGSVRHDPMKVTPALIRYGRVVGQRELDKQVQRSVARVEKHRAGAGSLRASINRLLK